MEQIKQGQQPSGTRWRHEKKFMISRADYMALRQKLKLIMKPDTHAGANGMYRITSIYFDNFYDKALNDKLCEEYVKGGKLSETLTVIHGQIDDAVKEDPTSFYKYTEYEAAGKMFEKVLQLRAESILGQINGTIPKTWADQEKDTSSLVDCTGIDLTVMGGQGGGKQQFPKK